MMIPPRWRKVFSDIVSNKTRTLLVVTSIAIGVFAMGMITTIRILLEEDLSSAYLATNPSSAILYTDDFDEDMIYSIRKLERVSQAEGRRNVEFAVQVGPDEWKDVNVLILEDYESINLRTITPVEGEWPPPYKGLVIERASVNSLNVSLGDRVVVKTSDRREKILTFTSTAHDINAPPVQFTSTPNVFISQDTLEWLGYDSGFDELHILVEGDATDKTYIKQVADEVGDKLEKSGREVYFTWVPEPGKHVATEITDALLSILAILGAFSLFASAFLVTNIINSILAQHIRQIAIMKSVGARTAQLFFMYLVTVMILGLLSLIIAVPLSGIIAYGFTASLATLVNFDLAGFRIPATSLYIMIGIALIVPVLAALYPVIQGTKLTIREALGDAPSLFGTHFLDRIVEKITGKIALLSRPVRIAIRNTIRKKSRLILTVFTLTLGGSIFISVLSVWQTLNVTLDDALTYFSYDVQVDFTQIHRIEEVQRQLEDLPIVADSEIWAGTLVRRVRSNNEKGQGFPLMAPPTDTTVIRPTLLEGRWLEPTDSNAVVLNSLVLRDEPDIKVGDTIVLEIEGDETEWQVVGIVQGVLTGGIAFTNRDYLARLLRFVDRAASVLIVTHQHDSEHQTETAAFLTEYFDSLGMTVASTTTTEELREGVQFQFGIIISLLSAMSILVALVGGLGLAGTMSINVLERTREIGVMRAVGASSRTIMKIVLVEGVMVGMISWLMSSAVAYPMGQFISNLVGQRLLQSSLNYQFSTSGIASWLIGVIIISAISSFLPAWNASRISVNETLAYE